jgi:hypothetical protein
MASRTLSKSLRPPRRNLASASSISNPNTLGPFQVFDRSVKRLHKDRAVRNGGERSRVVDYVREEVANRMAERFTVGCSLTYQNCLEDVCCTGHQTQV